MLQRTMSGEPLPWYKTLHQYYQRPPWELYNLQTDPQELHNLIGHPSYADIQHTLKLQLSRWMNVTNDPWRCSPGGVLEDSGPYKANPQCMTLDNGLGWEQLRDVQDRYGWDNEILKFKKNHL